MVQAVWINYGILTHELSKHVFANNLHDLSACVNRHIEPLGWGIIKTRVNGSSASSAWYLVPLNALDETGAVQ